MKKLNSKTSKKIGRGICFAIGIGVIIWYNISPTAKEFEGIFEGMAVFLTLVEIEKFLFEE